jgi:hypothetical protein
MSITTRLRAIEGADAVRTAAGTDERAALRSAIEARQICRHQVRGATTAAERTKALLGEATGKLAAFGDLDAEILQHRASGIRRQAVDGGPTPDMTLPGEMVARRAARDDAREILAASKAAHDGLLRELETARVGLQKAESLVNLAVRAVMQEQTNALALQLDRLWHDLWFAADQLNARASEWLPGTNGPRPLEVPYAATEILRMVKHADFRELVGGRNLGRERMGAEFRSWHAALLNDAAAPAPDTDGS